MAVLKTLVYGNTRIELENADTMNDQQIKDTVSSIYPELANAQVVRSGNEITFSLQAGTKGALGVVKYGQTSIELEGLTDMTDEQIKSTVSSIYPELANAQVVRNGNEVTFSLQAGTKGALGVVKYGQTSIELEGLTDMTDDQIKSTVSSIYPELANAQVVRNGNEVTFSLQAGTKGALGVVKYGQTSIELEGLTDMTDEQIKSTVSSIYPELANAQVVRNGNEVTFSLQAGTKGALGVVKYGQTSIELEGLTDMTDDQIKSTVSSIYPELANAQVVRNGNEVTFSLQAGTKGALGVVKYGQTSIELEGLTDMTDEQIKSTVSSIYPELANAQVIRNGNEVTFSLQAGTKGDVA